jgi:hypothetical protein
MGFFKKIGAALSGALVGAIGAVGAIDWADVAASPKKLVYVGLLVVGGAVATAARGALDSGKQ